jgi:hypothetical protein
LIRFKEVVEVGDDGGTDDPRGLTSTKNRQRTAVEQFNKLVVCQLKREKVYCALLS